MLTNSQLLTKTPLPTQQWITFHWFHVMNTGSPLLVAHELPVRLLFVAVADFDAGMVESETRFTITAIRFTMQDLSSPIRCACQARIRHAAHVRVRKPGCTRSH
jgi:hypothetical protein